MNTNNAPNPWESYSITTHFCCKCGWKFPWLGDYYLVFENIRSMTHPLNIPHKDNHKVKDDQLTQKGGQDWSADMV